jgi:thiaminase/transcriptional activator TenA
MILAESFRKEFDNLWKMIESHPFLTDLEKGNLPFEKFVYYIVQDCYYLHGWNRALFVAAARARNWKSQQDCIRLLLESNKEIAAVRKLALAVGATEEEINDIGRISSSCAAYTDWFLRVAYQGTLEELASAMLVCPWTYGSSRCGGLDLGERFSKALIENYHVRRDVVDSEIYGSAEYIEGVEDFKRLTSRDSDTVGEEEVERRRTNFGIASDFEYKFWETAYRHDTEKKRHPASYY